MSLLRHGLVAVLIAAAAAIVAAAPAPASVQVEELTWTELRDAIKAGKTTVIVPVGGTEQSGPHIVLGNALVAPVIGYVPEGAIDPPAGHMRFAGTISIPESAFEATLEGAARSFRQAGFRDIVLIGDHGGYQKSLAKVATKLDREWAKQASPVRVHAIEEYYRAVDRDFAQALRQQGFTDAEIGTHAGAADTSLALAVDEQLVRSALLHDGSALGPANGVHGDPRRASAAAGRAGIDLIVARTRDAIQREVARR
jgi:creatinine amidohydrolase/Fe(II)-dependent formamide hydrolase-like protein